MENMKRFTVAAFPVALFLLWMTADVAFAQGVTTFSVKPFTDVPTSSPYYTAIEYLRSHNMLKGEYSDGMYHPDQRLRRNVLVQMMTSEFFMASRDNSCLQPMKPGEMLFNDVPKDDGYALDICNAKATDLIRGYPDGFFRPTRAVNFVEAAKIVTRVLRINVTQGDVSDARWYVSYVNALSSANAIPTSITRLGQPLTRGELAEIVYRLETNTTNKASMHASDFDL